MKRNILVTILFATAFAVPNLVQAQNICWIEQVTQTSNGMALRFASHASLRVSVVKHDTPDARVFYGVGNGVARLQNPNGSLGDESEIVLRIDDEASVSQLLHDSCLLRAVNQDGKAGIDAQAHMNMPGLPPQTARTFVVAQ